MGCYDYKKEIRQTMPEDAVMDPSESALEGSDVKAYVDVVANFDADGRIRPLWLIWEDGRRYDIDSVKSVQRAASRRAGGVGIRYSCMVRGNPIELYYEGSGRWFVCRT